MDFEKNKALLIRLQELLKDLDIEMTTIKLDYIRLKKENIKLKAISKLDLSKDEIDALVYGLNAYDDLTDLDDMEEKLRDKLICISEEMEVNK